MKVTIESGTSTSDAYDLGWFFDIPPERILAEIRSGAITPLMETGINEDTGWMRFPFLYKDIRVRLTCTEDREALRNTRLTTGDR